MDKQIKELTATLSKKCGGQGAAVVIGAALNLVAAAVEGVPNHTLHAGLAAAFRDMADQFDGLHKPIILSALDRR